MHRPPLHVLALLVLLVGGITALFATRAGVPRPAPSPRTSAEPAPPAPLAGIAPRLRGLRTQGGDAVAAEGSARSLVLAALEGLPPPPRAHLLRALVDEDWAVQWGGLLGLARYGPPDEDLRAALLPLLASEEAPVRRAAAQASAALGEDAEGLEGPLRALVGDDDPAVRAAAVHALGRRAALHTERVPLFREALADPAKDVRAAAAAALAQVESGERLAPEDVQELVAALAVALRDPSADVRMYAAMAVGRAGPAARRAVPALVDLLADEQALVQGQAATALGSMGTAALPALEAALAREDGRSAVQVLWALRLVGAPALPVLERAFAHPHAVVRVQAALKHWEISRDDARAVQRLVAALDPQETDAVLHAARGLGRIGRAARQAEAALRALAAHPDDVVRKAVAGALAAIGSEGDAR